MKLKSKGHNQILVYNLLKQKPYTIEELQQELGWVAAYKVKEILKVLQDNGLIDENRRPTNTTPYQWEKP